MKTCPVNDTFKRMKRQAAVCVKMFANCVSHKGFVSITYKEASDSTRGKQPIPKVDKRLEPILNQRVYMGN